MRAITENTKVSLGVAWTVLGLILLGYAFVFRIDSKADAAAADIAEMKESQKMIGDMAADIKVIRTDIQWLKSQRRGR